MAESRADVHSRSVEPTGISKPRVWLLRNHAASAVMRVCKLRVYRIGLWDTGKHWQLQPPRASRELPFQMGWSGY